MTQDDIYGSKKGYEMFKAKLSSLLIKPSEKSKRLYYCRNSANLQYFHRLFAHFEAKDLSYIRRLRLLRTMKLIVASTDLDLIRVEREEVDKMMAFMHSRNAAPRSKHDFVIDLKFIWKILFPEKDEKGRDDPSVVPYVVRHLSSRIDKSREKRRGDKLTFIEFEKLVSYFGSDPMVQLYLMTAFETLARPQELLYLRVRDVEVYDNYAKLQVSEHTKEGIKTLLIIDSFPFLVRWLESHPLRKNKEMFLFIYNDRMRGQQAKPHYLNLLIKRACQSLGIEKPITCYSLKRNGVTFRRLRGDSDVEIQHVAGWTSTKQLKVYDLSQRDEILKMQLIKKGLLYDPKYKELTPETKECLFCREKNGFTQEACSSCKRPLDREKLKQLEEKANEEVLARLQAQELKLAEMQEAMTKSLQELKAQIVKKDITKKLNSIINKNNF